MKKVLLSLILIMAVLVVNAHATKTSVIQEKPLRTPVMVADQSSYTDGGICNGERKACNG